MTQEREEEYLHRFQELKQQHDYSEMLEEYEQIPFLRVPLQPWVYDMMEAIVPSIIVLSTAVVVIHLLFGLYLLSEIEGFFDKTVALNNSHLCEL